MCFLSIIHVDELSLGMRVFACMFIFICIMLAWCGNAVACYAVHITRRHDPVLGKQHYSRVISVWFMIVHDSLLYLLILKHVVANETSALWYFHQSLPVFEQEKYSFPWVHVFASNALKHDIFFLMERLCREDLKNSQV